MTYIPVGPVITSPAPPSRQTQELADLLGRVVQEYEKAHPTVTGPEVREALQLARGASTKGAGSELMAIRLTLILGVTMMAGLGVFFVMQQGGGFDFADVPLEVAIVALAIVGGLVTFLKRNR